MREKQIDAIDAIGDLLMGVHGIAKEAELRSIAAFAEIMVRYVMSQRDAWVNVQDGDAYYGVAQAIGDTVFARDAVVAAEVKVMMKDHNHE